MAKSHHSTISRRNKILQKLEIQGEVFVSVLSNSYGVSEVTIRNDLDQLESKQLLLRSRGGAIQLVRNVGTDYQIHKKGIISHLRKKKIGQLAATLVKEGDTIIVDSGTTTAELVKNLNHLQNLTLITNAFNIIAIIKDKPNINLIILGGFLRKNSQSLVGPMAEKNLQNFRVNKVFIGSDSVDTNYGIYTPNIEEANLNEKMIAISDEIILLADSSKFNKKSFAFICPIEKIDKVITDKYILTEDKRRMAEKHIKVFIAK